MLCIIRKIFQPTEPGIYTVKVYVAGEHIKDSPFVMQVQPTNNNLKMADMRLSGVKPNFAAAKGQPVTFKIDVPDTGGRLLNFAQFAYVGICFSPFLFPLCPCLENHETAMSGLLIFFAF